jgi:hypothetical protein
MPMRILIYCKNLLVAHFLQLPKTIGLNSSQMGHAGVKYSKKFPII